MPDLRDIPAIIKLAEERAERFAAAWAKVNGADYLGWASLNPETRQHRIDAELAILGDLTQGDSRDAVARLVARAVGLECGATAPSFTHVAASPGSYSFLGEPEEEGYPAHWFMFAVADGYAFSEPDEEGWSPDGDRWRHVPGISTITDSAEALRLVALAVVR